jgi:hypothetical protein
VARLYPGTSVAALLWYLAYKDLVQCDGIRLERPVRPVGGGVVEVRRDACVKIRIDMAEISRRTSTKYAGLKIPCTLSVKNHETTSEHKLLGLQIRVFGTVSGLQYESICGDCKKKENRPGCHSLIDFHSKSDVVLPLRNSDERSISISFSFYCYPKHYNNNDSAYRYVIGCNIISPVLSLIDH